MNYPPEFQKDIDALPTALRKLLDAELAAGNSIASVDHSFPAAPVGAFFKLAQQVTTRDRASGDGLKFYARNSSLYSGEFTNAETTPAVANGPTLRRQHAH